MPGTPIAFKRGALANLPNVVSNGTIYITTDEGGMYVDAGNQRVRIGDFIPVNTVNDLPANGHAYETAMYYVKQGNILARWQPAVGQTAGHWIQINKAGVVNVSDGPNQTGNVISGITLVTDSTTGQLTLQLSRITVLTESDVSSLREMVSDHDTDLGILLGNTEQSIQGRINAAKQAITGGSTTTIAQIEAALEDMQTDLGDLPDRVSDLEDAVDGIETIIGADANSGLRAAVAANTSAITTLNANASTSGSVRNIVGLAIADVVAGADASFDTLKEIADWIMSDTTGAAAMANDIDDLKDAVEDLQDIVGADANSGLRAAVAANTSAITLLNGNSSTAGSVDYKIAQALISINSDISNIQDAIADLTELVEKHEEQLTWVDF